MRRRRWQTINRAAQLAQPGDTVLVHAGVYRERVAPARGGQPGQPIVYQAAPGETVTIKGSELWQPAWRKLSDNRPVFAGTLDAGLFAGERIHPYRALLKQSPAGHRYTLGQVFVDGEPFREVDSLPALDDTPSTWMASRTGDLLYIHFPDEQRAPTKRMVEITVRDRIFAPHRRGLGYVHVKGFTMEHCANQFPAEFWRSDSPQAGALGCRAGHHWLIANNTVRFAKSIGIDCGYEGKDLEGRQPTPQNSGHHLIRHNRVTDNGCCGIAGMRSTGTRIVGNVIERNNWNHHTAPEIAGIKVHYFVDGLIEGNLIRDNEAHGIWLDNVYRNSRVTRNLVLANRGNGVFVELGEGPVLIDNNVIALTRVSVNQSDPRGDGLYSHDASGIHFVHNLVFGNHGFAAFHRKVTLRPRAGASRITLLNNLFIDNDAGYVNLPYPGPDAQDNRSDHHVLGRDGCFVANQWGGTPVELIVARVHQALGHPSSLWRNLAPRLNLSEWQQVMGNDLHSIQVPSATAELSHDLTLTITLGHDPNQIPTEKWNDLDVDYFGRPIAPSGALPGPFQDLDGNHLLGLALAATGQRDVE